MTFRPVQRLMVSLEIEGDDRTVGELAWSASERRAYFQFDAGFLKMPLPVSPFHLPARVGLTAAELPPFDGLHGLFNDSLPDGWGRLLLDRRLRAENIEPALFTPLDRLAMVGTTGMGALCYRPAHTAPKPQDAAADFDWFADAVDKAQREVATVELDRLVGAQGSSAGARPKIMIGLTEDGRNAIIDYGHGLSQGYEPWLVKFRSREDASDIGAQEYAYALMARAAGIDMAPARLIETQRKNRLFATRRFDRTPTGRLHVHTASGLLQADHRYPALDYVDLLKLAGLLTRDRTQVLQLFRRMVFNIYAHNRDDHAKNHAFLMDRQGLWALSPAYDLTFSTGPLGEHSTTVAGEGRRPGTSHILKIAEGASIPKTTALAEIDRVREAIANWTFFAEEAGVSATSMARARRAFADKPE